MAALELKPRGAAMDTADDLALLNAIAEQRDRGAFTELVERHRERAYNMAYHILRNSALAEEALQESMLAVWLNAKTLRPEANAANWILRIVSGKSLNLKRNRTRSVRREERMSTIECGRAISAAEDAAERTELIGALRSQLEELPELDSQLLACSFGANMSHRQISEFFNLSQPTVGSKIQQALSRLRNGLTKAGVAAVVPLVSAENLFEAMTTGQTCPPGAALRVLKCIDNVGKPAARALSRRAVVKAGSAGSGPWAVLAVTVVLASGAAIAWRTSTPGTPAAQQAAKIPDTVTVQSEDPGWIPVSVDTSFTLHGKFDGSHDTQQFSQFSNSRGGSAIWKIEQTPTGTVLAQRDPKLPDHNVIVFSKDVSGPMEWSATLDDTDASDRNEIAVVVFDEALQGKIFGGHSVRKSKSVFRIVVWNTADGMKLIALRDPETKIMSGITTMKAGRYSVGILTNAALTLRDFRMRKLPADWTPRQDKFLSHFKIE